MLKFKQAFNAARKAGNRYFSWNGNDYNTMTKEEKDSGNILEFLKLNTNTGDNSNFQRAEKNLPFQMLGIFTNPIEGTYAGQNYNINSSPSPITHFASQDVSTPTNTNILIPNNFNRAQVRAFMLNRGLDPYAYTGGQRKALRKALNSGQDIEAIFNQWNQNNQPISYNAEGGLLKFEDGGSTKNQVMEAFKQWVAQKLQNGEIQESDLKDQEKLKQLFQSFTKEQQRVQTAMNGAKLNYINQLNGKCPQGTHLSYYRIGGTLCKKCEADAHNENSDPIKAFKQKCGGKVKKKELGGEMDNKKDKTKSKLIKKSQNKITPKKPQNPQPGPKDLKTLPNGKYPKYWTAYQRGQWDRDHNEGD